MEVNIKPVSCLLLNINRKPGTGRKATGVTPRLINIVKSRIRRNPIRSMRGMAKELKVSEFSIRKIVKQEPKNSYLLTV
jgi:hypothetical protein